MIIAICRACGLQSPTATANHTHEKEIT